MPLTDLACRNARCPEGVPYVRLADGGGLYLEVTAAGGKLWRWKYRFGGKEKRLALGKYPEVPLARRVERDRDTATQRIIKGARELRDEAGERLQWGGPHIQWVAWYSTLFRAVRAHPPRHGLHVANRLLSADHDR